jgi:uncharacterized protein YtpQ (UPF0354 family)
MVAVQTPAEAHVSNQDERSLRRTFGDLVIEALRRGGVLQPIAFDENAFTLRVGQPPGDHVTANLGNVYRDWSRSTAEARLRIVERFAGAISDTRQPRGSTNERLQTLLPIVRERFSVHGIGDPRDVRSRIRSAPLAADWVVLLAEDRPDAIMTLPETALAELGAPFEGLMDVALSNLRRANARWLPQGADGIWVAASNDSYDASRVLLPERWRAAGLSGRVVAMAPDRDMLMMTRASDRPGLHALAMMSMQRLRERHRLLSGLPITRDLDDPNDTWTPFSPPAPLVDEFRRAARLFEAVKYEEQFAAFESLDPSTPDTARAIPRINGRSTGGGRDAVESVAAWAGTVPALMPRADKVMFTCEGAMYIADWRQLMDRLADATGQMGHYPERWRLERAPTRDDVTATGAVLIESVPRMH